MTPCLDDDQAPCYHAYSYTVNVRLRDASKAVTTLPPLRFSRRRLSLLHPFRLTTTFLTEEPKLLFTNGMVQTRLNSTRQKKETKTKTPKEKKRIRLELVSLASFTSTKLQIWRRGHRYGSWGLLFTSSASAKPENNLFALNSVGTCLSRHSTSASAWLFDELAVSGMTGDATSFRMFQHFLCLVHPSCHSCRSLGRVPLFSTT